MKAIGSQLVAYKSLVQRNRERERLQGRPPHSAILYLPYIIVSASKKTMVECAIAPDKFVNRFLHS
jgi:hypothetical protein